MAKKLSRKLASVPEGETPTAPPPAEESAVEPILYNTDDACLMLGKISKPMLYRLISTKQIHPIKVGSRSMFTKQELERYVRQCAADQPA